MLFRRGSTTLPCARAPRATGLTQPAQPLQVSHALQSAGYPLPVGYNTAEWILRLLDEGLVERFGREQQTDPPSLAVDEFPGGDSRRALRPLLVQAYWLARREGTVLRRDVSGWMAALAMPCFLNALFACIFFEAGRWDTPGYTLQTHFGAVTQIAIGGLFATAQPVLLKFPLEAALFRREHEAGAYSGLAYFCAKTAVELPKNLLTATLAWAFTYWTVGLEGPFLLYVLCLWLLGVAASSTSLLVSCVSPNPEVAIQAGPIVFVPQLLFSGFFIRISQVPHWLRWAQYLCSLKYGINLLLIVAFGPSTTAQWEEPFRTEAQQLLEQESVDATRWPEYAGILCAISLGFRTLAFTILSCRQGGPALTCAGRSRARPRAAQLRA